MNEDPRSPKDILEDIVRITAEDKSYGSGKAIGSMCTYPDAFAAEVYKKYLDKNIGDSNLFPGIAHLEKEVIQSMGDLLHLPQATGAIVTGGTEGNLLGLWAHREFTKKHTIIAPISCHYSIPKIANMLSLKIKYAPVDEQHRMIPDALPDLIDDDTFCIVAIAGTTELGMIDPIEEIAEIIADTDIYIHVDAAFGGFVIPFLEKLSYPVRTFDFRIPKVSSITMDPHKMGCAPIPAGGILFRDPHIAEMVRFHVSYLAGGITTQTTFVGTRSGASVAATWALFQKNGIQGFLAQTKNCMNRRDYFIQQLQHIPDIHPIVTPDMNIVGITSNTKDITKLANKLRTRDWGIALFKDHFRIVITPSVTIRVLDNLLSDLQEVISCIPPKI